jgi:hypothetical protein
MSRRRSRQQSESGDQKQSLSNQSKHRGK